LSARPRSDIGHSLLVYPLPANFGGLHAMRQPDVPQNIEPDATVQAFSQYLTELKARNSRTLQEMLSEMSIIRDGITSNNVELTDFKRHSTSISQQMQSQLSDLREKLTSAFGEITSLVKQKTQSDQEMMTDINSVQTNLSTKTAELEALKTSYSQAHQQLQSSLIQIQNHLGVTSSEVLTAKATCERVQRETTQRFSEIDEGLHRLEDQLSVGNVDNRNQMMQLQGEIARIHESLHSVSAEFADHKRATSSVHNKLQSQLWGMEEQHKRSIDSAAGSASNPQGLEGMRHSASQGAHVSYAPMEPGTAPMEPTAQGGPASSGPFTVSQPAGMPAGSRWMGSGSPAGSATGAVRLDPPIGRVEPLSSPRRTASVPPAAVLPTTVSSAGMLGAAATMPGAWSHAVGQHAATYVGPPSPMVPGSPLQHGQPMGQVQYRPVQR